MSKDETMDIEYFNKPHRLFESAHNFNSHNGSVGYGWKIRETI